MAQTLNFGKQRCAGSDGLPPPAKFNFGEENGRQKMFALGSFKTFLSNRRADSVGLNQMEAKSRVATAALLVRVATVDSDMSEVRSKLLRRILMSSF
jgi:uncharacterized tellurite resistance protein B-like protein